MFNPWSFKVRSLTKRLEKGNKLSYMDANSLIQSLLQAILLEDGDEEIPISQETLYHRKMSKLTTAIFLNIQKICKRFKFKYFKKQPSTSKFNMRVRLNIISILNNKRVEEFCINKLFLFLTNKPQLLSLGIPISSFIELFKNVILK